MALGCCSRRICGRATRASAGSSAPAGRPRRVVLSVADPDVSVSVHVNSVGKNDQSRAEALHELAGGVELQDGIEVRVEARVGTATLADPDARAVFVDFDRARRSPRSSCGKLEVVLDGAIRVGRVVDRENAGLRPTSLLRGCVEGRRSLGESDLRPAARCRDDRHERSRQ